MRRALAVNDALDDSWRQGVGYHCLLMAKQTKGHLVIVYGRMRKKGHSLYLGKLWVLYKRNVQYCAHRQIVVVHHTSFKAHFRQVFLFDCFEIGLLSQSHIKVKKGEKNDRSQLHFCIFALKHLVKITPQQSH